MEKSQDIDPRLDSLPDECKREYLLWAETYHRLHLAYLDNVEKLKEIRNLDPAHAAIYDWKIDSLLQEASETMDEWLGLRQRLHDKWLPTSER